MDIMTIIINILSGKTTCLAAAVLSHVSAGHRVLVVTPSHAACDAITLALAQHWPGHISGQVSGGWSGGEHLASDGQ